MWEFDICGLLYCSSNLFRIWAATLLLFTGKYLGDIHFLFFSKDIILDSETVTQNSVFHVASVWPGNNVPFHENPIKHWVTIEYLSPAFAILFLFLWLGLFMEQMAEQYKQSSYQMAAFTMVWHLQTEDHLCFPASTKNKVLQQV